MGSSRSYQGGEMVQVIVYLGVYLTVAALVIVILSKEG